MKTYEPAAFEPAQRMRHAGGMVLGALWTLLLAACSAPLWVPGYVSWDFAVTVDPPGRTWMAVALAAIVLLLPPLLLVIATWRWLRRHRGA